METAKYFIVFLVFPGFLFTAVAGLFSSWVERKVTARLQWRVGPPLFQPLYDLVKLLGKETILPAGGNHLLFISSPLVGLIGITLVSAILWLVNLANVSFLGDLIVVAYLLIIPPLSVMLGAFASANPLAVTGASREMKLILAYELPFLAALATAIFKAGPSIRLTEIARASPIASVSGVLAFIVALLCIQAKLGYSPFDIAEAETEIMEGPYIEYSGFPLALIKLSQAMQLFTLAVFLATVFLGGLRFYAWGILWAVLKILAVLVLIIVIKNTNPRVRIDQALGFFWRCLAPLAAAAFILAAVGRAYGISWL